MKNKIKALTLALFCSAALSIQSHAAANPFTACEKSVVEIIQDVASTKAIEHSCRERTNIPHNTCEEFSQGWVLKRARRISNEAPQNKECETALYNKHALVFAEIDKKVLKDDVEYSYHHWMFLEPALSNAVNKYGTIPITSKDRTDLINISKQLLENNASDAWYGKFHRYEAAQEIPSLFIKMGQAKLAEYSKQDFLIIADLSFTLTNEIDLQTFSKNPFTGRSSDHSEIAMLIPIRIAIDSSLFLNARNIFDYICNSRGSSEYSEYIKKVQNIREFTEKAALVGAIPLKIRPQSLNMLDSVVSRMPNACPLK